MGVPPGDSGGGHTALRAENMDLRAQMAELEAENTRLRALVGSDTSAAVLAAESERDDMRESLLMFRNQFKEARSMMASSIVSTVTGGGRSTVTPSPPPESARVAELLATVESQRQRITRLEQRWAQLKSSARRKSEIRRETAAAVRGEGDVPAASSPPLPERKH